MELTLTLNEDDETSLKILAIHWQTTPQDAALRAIRALALTRRSQGLDGDALDEM